MARALGTPSILGSLLQTRLGLHGFTAATWGPPCGEYAPATLCLLSVASWTLDPKLYHPPTMHSCLLAKPAAGGGYCHTSLRCPISYPETQVVAISVHLSGFSQSKWLSRVVSLSRRHPQRCPGPCLSSPTPLYCDKSQPSEGTALPSWHLSDCAGIDCKASLSRG